MNAPARFEATVRRAVCRAAALCIQSPSVSPPSHYKKRGILKSGRTFIVRVDRPAGAFRVTASLALLELAVGCSAGGCGKMRPRCARREQRIRLAHRTRRGERCVHRGEQSNDILPIFDDALALRFDATRFGDELLFFTDLRRCAHLQRTENRFALHFAIAIKCIRGQKITNSGIRRIIADADERLDDEIIACAEILFLFF